MQPDKKDQPANVIMLAVVLCIVCSTVVSTAAIGLRSIQDANIALDRKKNILSVTGLTSAQTADEINELFEQRFSVDIIDLDTGYSAVADAMSAMDAAGKKFASEEETLVKYDQVWASKSKLPTISDALAKADDKIKIKYREKFSHVYTLKSESGEIEKYVFPVRGYGLWSMMKGYLAVEPDLQTIAGLTFYDQKETPGLGGEIMSSKFKSQWPDKKIYNDDGDVEIKVVKAAPKDKYSIDALTGATITSNGVSEMMKYWMGPQGFGPYIEKQKQAAQPQTSMILTGGQKNG